MVGKEIAVKKYVVRLSAEERAQLDELIRKGKRSAQLLTKARILLKADVSERGEGWSDSRIAAALDTSIATIERTRRQLVEEGFEAVLRRKYNPNSARPRIFDGAAEAKLIALTLSPAPEGLARWSLRLLEEKVVELHIVERNTGDAHRPFSEHRAQGVAGGLGHHPLRRTLRPEFGRIDAAQPDLGVEARPDMDARLEGVAVDNPQHLGGMGCGRRGACNRGRRQ